MASKTALPIARLRALGARVSPIIGHWPDAPVQPSWQYSITLPKGVALPIGEKHGSLQGVASAHVARDGRIVVRAFAPGGTQKIAKADRERIASDVAALLSRLADVLNGRSA